MTTDYYQNHIASRAAAKKPGVRMSVLRNGALELSRSEGFLAGRQDIFDVLTQCSRERVANENNGES